MNEVRRILWDADNLRSKAKEAQKAADLLKPGVGLGLAIGSYRVDEPDTVKAVQASLAGVAADLNARADVLEAQIEVRR